MSAHTSVPRPADHINFSGINPLATERQGGGWQTPYLSMAELYDAESYKPRVHHLLGKPMFLY